MRSVDIGSAVGLMLADLQTERLESVGYLVGVATSATSKPSASQVDEQVSDLGHNTDPTCRRRWEPHSTASPV